MASHKEKTLSWQNDLAECFDRVDRLFALHSMDDERAFRLLAKLRAEGVTWLEFSNAVRELLDADGCSVQHVEFELKQAEPRFRPWLAE